MSYTPMPEDQKEYLEQIRRPRDAMIGAIDSDPIRIPAGVREVAIRQITDAYKTIEFWLRFHAAPEAPKKPMPFAHADREA